MKRSLNRIDTFYNPVYSQEEENFAMIANCSYYRPTRNAFDWLTEIKDDNRFGFGLITVIQSDPDSPTKFNNAWKHEDQEQKKRRERLLQKN